MGEPDALGSEIPIFQVEKSRHVYVPLQKLMHGVFADLHGTKACTETYQLFHEKIENAQFLGFKASMNFDCPSSLVPSGRIKTRVSGAVHYGNVQAEKDCMIKMLANIHDQFHLFPADFSFVEIQRNRALFNAMKNVLEPARINFRELYSHMSEIHEELFSPCLKLTVWVGQSLNLVSKSDLATVSRFYSKMSHQLDVFESEMNHCRRIRDLLELKNVEPEAMRLFEASVPVSTAIRWEHSYHTLEAVYRESVKKFRGGIGKLELFNFGAGEVRATLDVVGTPHHFCGDLASTKEVALGKLYYQVIKFVHDQFGYCIMDFNFAACSYQRAYIDRFDHDMSNLIKCGERLMLLFQQLFDVFEDSVAELLEVLELSDASSTVLEETHGCGVLLRAKKIYVNSKWDALRDRQVDRATLEFQCRHGK